MKSQILDLYQNYIFTVVLMISTAHKTNGSSQESIMSTTRTIVTMKLENDSFNTLSPYTQSIETKESTTEESIVKSSTQSINFSISRKHWTKSDDVPGKHRNTQSKVYRNKHHHEHHWGPFFEEPLNSTEGALQLIAYVDTETVLNCRVGMLRDKTVMWIRRTAEKVSLLTVGNITYSGDPRVKVKFQYPNNWRLLINPVQKEDASLYMCQVSTHPPKVFATNLTVLERPMRFVDEKNREVSDRFYKAGSTIDLTCQISKHFLLSKEQILKKRLNRTSNDFRNSTQSLSIEKQLNQFIFWRKDGTALPKNIIDNTSTTTEWFSSRITIPKASFTDEGLYSCSIANIYEVAVHVQVLTGELPAAVQHNSQRRCVTFLPIFLVLLLTNLQFFVHISPTI